MPPMGWSDRFRVRNKPLHKPQPSGWTPRAMDQLGSLSETKGLVPDRSRYSLRTMSTKTSRAMP